MPSRQARRSAGVLPDVLQGLLKKIEIDSLLSDQSFQVGDTSQCLRQLVRRSRRRRHCRIICLQPHRFGAPRTPSTTPRRRPANAKLLLPLIETLARDAELPRQLAHIRAHRHALHRGKLQLATEPSPRILFPHQSSFAENCYPFCVSVQGCTILCLRYDPLPISPGRTTSRWRRRRDLNRRPTVSIDGQICRSKSMLWLDYISRAIAARPSLFP